MSMITKIHCACSNRSDIVCDTTHCDIAGEQGQGVCRICWLRLNKRSKVLKRFTPTPCKFLSSETGGTVDCSSCGGINSNGKRKQIPLHSCLIHKVCTLTPGRIIDGEISRKVKCCKSCTDYQPSKLDEITSTHYIEITADGIGDHLLGLAAASKWKEDNPNNTLTFITKSWQSKWVELFDGYDYITSNTKPDTQPICNVAKRNGRHYAEAIQDYPLIQPTLKSLPQECLEWASKYKDCIVLCPGAGYRRPNSPDWAVNNRVWLPSHWLVLEKLLLESGRRVITIDSDPNRIKHHKEPLINLKATKVAALLKVASCTVSNESGMAHLAGALGISCVVLCGALDGNKIHKIWYRSKVIQGPLPCSGCRWTGPDFKSHCNTLCASLQSIQPEDVISVVNNITNNTTRLRELVNIVDGAEWNKSNRLFRHTIDLLEEKSHPLIIETGCQRQEYDVGAGMSTLIFGLLTYLNNGQLISIDNDQDHVNIATKVTSGLPVKVIKSCSVAFLKEYSDKPIDLLYLDSLDTYVDGHAEHCKLEVEVSLNHLAPEALILIDDTFYQDNEWTGKGRLAVPYLLSQGWRVILTSHQTLLTRDL